MGKKKNTAGEKPNKDARRNALLIITGMLLAMGIFYIAWFFWELETPTKWQSSSLVPLPGSVETSKDGKGHKGNGKGQGGQGRNSTTSATTVQVETTAVQSTTPSPSPTPVPTETTAPTKDIPSIHATPPELLAAQQLAYEQMIALSSGNGLPSPIQQKFVFLTFDDGPSTNTSTILDVLKQNQVPATFFVKHSEMEDMYRRIVDEGHSLALHTFSHRYNELYQNDEAYFADLQQISDYVKALTGIESKILRFPGGSSNTVSSKYSPGIMSRLSQEVGKRGYSYYDWNADSGDATSKAVSPEDILQNLRQYTFVGKTHKPYLIVLMHDAPKQVTTAEALQGIIDYYRSEGYTFCPLRFDSPAIHQRISN